MHLVQTLLADIDRMVPMLGHLVDRLTQADAAIRGSHPSGNPWDARSQLFSYFAVAMSISIAVATVKICLILMPLTAGLSVLRSTRSMFKRCAVVTLGALTYLAWCSYCTRETASFDQAHIAGTALLLLIPFVGWAFVAIASARNSWE